MTISLLTFRSRLLCPRRPPSLSPHHSVAACQLYIVAAASSTERELSIKTTRVGTLYTSRFCSLTSTPLEVPAEEAGIMPPPRATETCIACWEQQLLPSSCFTNDAPRGHAGAHQAHGPRPFSQNLLLCANRLLDQTSDP